MKKRLTRSAPVRAGVLIALAFWFDGALLVILGLATLGTTSLINGGKSESPTAVGIIFLAVFGPLLYAAGGLVAGIVIAAFYNLPAKWTGGLEFELADLSE